MGQQRPRIFPLTVGDLLLLLLMQKRLRVVLQLTLMDLLLKLLRCGW
jgi:hypothetical protein